MNSESQDLVSWWEKVEACQFPIPLVLDAVSMHGVY